MRLRRSLKSTLVEDKTLFILYIQYHGYWWLGESQSQGISSHGVDHILPEYSSVSTKKVPLISVKLITCSNV